MNKPVIGFALCGSFCTFASVIPQIKILKDSGFDLIPIMSEIAYSTNTRFGKAEDFTSEIEALCEHAVWHTAFEVEPIGPKKLLDLLIIEPATGNTLAKLAAGIADTPVTLAAKAHLRNSRPILIGVSTNDALAGNAANIGKLLNTPNYYFLPLRQDDYLNKPRSVVASFDKTLEYAVAAMEGIQMQPIIKS